MWRWLRSAQGKRSMKTCFVSWPLCSRINSRCGSATTTAISHRIEAGADMFLMPSQYEPCGLSQIYSLRYGTVPIVRATGGLDDTVDASTGFKFVDYTPEGLQGAIEQALDAFEKPGAWIARMRRGMAKDFSWDTSAAAYQRLMRSL